MGFSARLGVSSAREYSVKRSARESLPRQLSHAFWGMDKATKVSQDSNPGVRTTVVTLAEAHCCERALLHNNSMPLTTTSATPLLLLPLGEERIPTQSSVGSNQKSDGGVSQMRGGHSAVLSRRSAQVHSAQSSRILLTKPPLSARLFSCSTNTASRSIP